MPLDLSQFVVGGATRPDSLTGFQPQFATSLASMFAGAPPEVQNELRISSGYRSPQRQTELWQQALQKYGSVEAARKWVAPPGRSQHNHGNAADLKYMSDEAMRWAHKNAARYGLAFPLGNENWHVELAGARGGHTAPAAPVAAAAPVAPAVPVGVGPTVARAATGVNFDGNPLSPPVQAGGLGPVPTPEMQMPQQPTLGSLASMFIQQTNQRRQAEEEAAAAEQARLQALFGGPSPFG